MAFNCKSQEKTQIKPNKKYVVIKLVREYLPGRTTFARSLPHTFDTQKKRLPLPVGTTQ